MILDLSIFLLIHHGLLYHRVKWIRDFAGGQDFYGQNDPIEKDSWASQEARGVKMVEPKWLDAYLKKVGQVGG